MRKDIIDKKNDIVLWVKQNQSKAFICRELNCKPQTLEKYLKILNIVYKGNKGLLGKKTSHNKKSFLELKDSPTINSHRLKLKLISEGIKEKKCESCGLSKWNGKEIPLELHHVDGNRFNNELNNLQIICPNCHAQTDNFCSKKYKKKYFCECGNLVTKHSKKCKSCSKLNLNRKVERPDYETLVKEIKEMGYCGTGRKYGVSDNAIRKWVKIYENKS